VAVLIVIIIFVLIGVVVLVVGAPLRRAAAATGLEADSAALEREEAVRGDQLEAAREAKYREIRDAEMDFRTGKLSEADYRLLDAELRAEALEILDGLQTLRAEGRGEER
jgi:hypothetical protein